MTFNQLIKKIKQDSWWSEESPGNYEIILTAWRCFVAQNLVYQRKFLSICVALYKDDYSMEKTSEQEKLKQFYWALKIFERQPQFFKKAFVNYKRAQKELLTYGQWAVDQCKELSDKELASAYLRIYQLAVLHFANAIIPESGDIYTDHFLLKDLTRVVKDHFDRNFLVDASVVLSGQPMLSFMEKERLAFLKMALARKPDFKRFSQQYHWMQNNYLRAKFLSAGYFKKEATKLLKEKSKREIRQELTGLESKVRRLKIKQKQLLRQLALPKRLQDIFGLLRFFSRWIDERKFGAVHMVYYIDTVFEEIARRLQVKRELLEYATPEELSEFLLNKKPIPKKALISRRKLSAYVVVPAKSGFREMIFTGKKAQKIFQAFNKKATGQIKGFPASAPVKTIKGKVQVVVNPHREKFIPGRILVASMTRPDFLPLMHQAAAIITDEGGTTSHAAIVSRELGIACVIGTKNGSKILKTGDVVEVDVEQGVVKIIKGE